MRKRPVYPDDNRTATFPIATLPFVSPRPRGKPHCWNVPPVDGSVKSYQQAEATGRQYAQQFLRWLQANPGLIGMGILGWIASDIDYKAPDRKAYWIGFFACIECLLVDPRGAD